MMRSSKPILAVFVIAALAACQSGAKGTPTTEVVAAPGTGSISGRIESNAETAPAAHVCAIAATTLRRAGCVRTQAGQASYRIDGLPPGNYAVYGWYTAAGAPPGKRGVARARELRMCIKAPCPLGPPLDIALVAGEHYERAHLNDFADDFPGMPDEPRD